eukprot:CAMPEP_0204898078 /NCGR_PEP_ID=MMETSP1397-20131031/1084_1 /ASSEMBLY_ACC=CAM_ASM_000891 /TAXON_ID=49980 /ORGANISM="Climacostomum Climacostomum virens, Strain Stock W-24" /LENGTH=123 /DNA_ID=CAMNT_0052065881 /DNA_START=398 /DNA_END=769 /DNA_ORIENTATION=+
MAFHTQVETAKPVARQTISTTLQNDGSGLVAVHDLIEDRLIDIFEALIIHSLEEREVDAVAVAFAVAGVSEVACVREVVAKLVEATEHYPIGRVEGFFHAIAVVDVDVNVAHSMMRAEKLKDT